jgi:hypothetical protein
MAISNFDIFNKYTIFIQSLDNNDIWKIPAFVLDKSSFKITSMTTPEEYNINDINYMEE